MLTEKDKKLILELKEAGQSVSIIAKRFEVDRKTIHYHLKNATKKIIERKSKGGPTKKAPKKPAPKVKLKKYQDYLKENIGKKFIRNELGEIIKIENNE